MIPASVTRAGLYVGPDFSPAVSAAELGDLKLRPPYESTALASPKSSTFTVPSGRTLMLAGFRSR